MSVNRTYYSEEMLLNQSFIMFPKWLMSDKEFSKLSNDAKVLYVNLKDRYRLSLKNHWVDSDGKAFLVCKRSSMEKMLNKSERTIKKIVEELIAANLIEEKQNGCNKPNYIYLLMPELCAYQDYEFEEDNYVAEEYLEGTRNNYGSEPVEFTAPDPQDLRPNKNNKNNNNCNNESKNLIVDDNDLKEVEKNIQKIATRVYEPIEGVLVNEKQLMEINELVKMVGSGELRATKASLFKYIKQLYDMGFKDHNGKKIINLKSYVAMNFKLRTKQNEMEMEEIKKMAEKGDRFAQEIVNWQSPDYELY